LLAQTLREKGEFQRAADALRDAVSLNASLNARMIPIHLDLIAALAESDQLDEAQRHADKLKEIAETIEWPLATLTAKVGQARVLMGRAELESAEQMLRDAAGSSQTREFPRANMHAFVVLSECLVQMQRFQDAEASLLALILRVQRGRVYSRSDQRRVILQLVALYEAWDKPDKAAPWRAQLEP
jgi:tetratricopeptide (TPR) repeat protein